MKNLYVVSLVTGLALSVNANAAVFSAEIQSIDKKRSKVLVVSKKLNKVQKGDILNLGKSCTLEVAKRTKNKAILTTDLCENMESIQKGRTVQLSTDDFRDSTASTSSSSGNSTHTNFYRPEVRDYTKTSEGFRVGIVVKSLLDGKMELKDSDGLGYSVSDDIEHDFGIVLGYANIGINSPGFLGNLIYTQFNDRSNSIRLEGNGTYGINKNVYFLGGLNLHKFTKGLDRLDLGIGFQAGAGVQINQNFGLNLTYVTLNNDGNINNEVDVDFEANGLELSLHGTF